MKKAILSAVLPTFLLSGCATPGYPTVEERRQKEAEKNMTFGEKVENGVLETIAYSLAHWGS